MDQSLYTVILEPKKRKPITVSNFPPSICHEVIVPQAMILFFWMLNFKPGFSLSSSTLLKRLFRSIIVVSSLYLRLLIFLLAILILSYGSSTLAFCMMYSASKLNIQLFCTPFPVWNQLVVTVHPKGDKSCEELTHLKRPRCWEGLGAGGEGDNRV